MSARRTGWLAALVLVSAVATPRFAAAAPFSYQGYLEEGDQPASGDYEFEFRLYDSPAGGVPLDTIIYGIDGIEDGLFTASLDFGPDTFDGTALWLEVAVRPAIDYPPDYTTLSPRERVSATPYASHVLDGPGLSHTYEAVGVYDMWTNVTLASAQIQCPSAGYVIASATAQVNIGEDQFLKLAIVPSDAGSSYPPDTYEVRAVGTVVVSCPATLQKVFPVSAAGEIVDVQLRGWGYSPSYSNRPDVSNQQLTLLFVPTAYGSVSLP